MGFLDQYNDTLNELMACAIAYDKATRAQSAVFESAEYIKANADMQDELALAAHGITVATQNRLMEAASRYAEAHRKILPK